MFDNVQLNGIYQLDFRTNKIIDLSDGLPHKSVYSLLRDSRGILYAGTYNGLARWNANSRSFHPVNVKKDISIPGSLFVNSLLESEDGESIYITRVRDKLSMKIILTALIFLHIQVVPPAYSQKSNTQ